MAQASLDKLPPELYIAIFEHFDGTPLERNAAVLALTRAIPRSPVPDLLLFEQICLVSPRQAYPLYRRLKQAPTDAARVRIFSYKCWSADADHVVNVLGLLQHVEEMTLWFGPDFAPEHLEDIFKNPRSGLKMLHMRFRP